MIKPSMPGMAPRRTGHIFQCLSVLLASCPLSLLTSCACQGSKPPLSRKRPQHPTNPQALSCFSPLLCRWKSFLFESLPFVFPSTCWPHILAQLLWWHCCWRSQETLDSKPGIRISSKNSWTLAWPVQRGRHRCIAVPACNQGICFDLWMSLRSYHLRKTLQMFKWFRNSQLTPFAWPSPYKAL